MKLSLHHPEDLLSGKLGLFTALLSTGGTDVGQVVGLYSNLVASTHIVPTTVHLSKVWLKLDLNC